MKLVASEPRPWPSGDSWAVAALSATPSEITEATGLRFTSDVDGLGETQLAAVEAGEAGQLWFFARPDAPDVGTEILVDMNVDRDTAIAWVRRSLAKSVVGLSWTAPTDRDPRRELSPRSIRRPTAGSASRPDQKNGKAGFERGTSTPKPGSTYAARDAKPPVSSRAGTLP